MATLLKIMGLLVGLALIIIAVIFWLTLRSPSVARDVTVTITEGEGVSKITQELQETGVIKNPTVFVWTVRLTGKSSKIFAGTYEFKKNQTLNQVIDEVTDIADASTDVKITVIEGWTSQQIAGMLAGKGFFPEADFVAAAKTPDIRTLIPDRSYAFLGDRPAAADLEGYLFPDTYRVKQRSKPADVIKRMLDNFDQKLTNQMRADIHKQGRTVFDVVILASILEREVALEGDKKNAADVFLKRLKIGMPLQSDATVNYVTGKGTTRPSLKDLEIDSPYNTYQHAGLPPGPISNPGLTSLQAAIYPTANPYYFFLTKDDGEAVFGSTLEQHNQNRAKYLTE